MEWNLVASRLSSVHLPEFTVITFDTEEKEAYETIITSEFKDGEDDAEYASIYSSAIYNENPISSTVELKLEVLRALMVDCVESENSINIFEHRDFVKTSDEIKNSFVSELVKVDANNLIMLSGSSRRFVNGLGIIYQEGSMVGVFESLHLRATANNNHYIQIEHILFNGGKNQLSDRNVSCEYYDLHENILLSFDGVCSSESGTLAEEIKIKYYEEIDPNNPILASIKEAYKVPFFEGEETDFISEKKNTDYRNSRLSVISQVRNLERKKSIANKFSDISLF